MIRKLCGQKFFWNRGICNRFLLICSWKIRLDHQTIHILWSGQYHCTNCRQHIRFVYVKKGKTIPFSDLEWFGNYHMFSSFKILGISEGFLSILSFLCAMCDCLTKGLATQQWYLYVGIGYSLLRNIASPMIRAILANTVPISEIGAFYSLTASIESVTPLTAAPLYSFVYGKTLNTYSGAFNFIGVGLFAGCSIGFLWVEYNARFDICCDTIDIACDFRFVYGLQKRHRQTRYDTIENREWWKSLADRCHRRLLYKPFEIIDTYTHNNISGKIVFKTE